ncbi:MAG: ion transporter [Bacteroidales bacterium]|nr:ion transporter [Bacteroidales bacterium]
MTISYIDIYDGNIVRLYNAEGHLLKQLKGMEGRPCGHGSDFVVMATANQYNVVAMDGQILSSYNNKVCQFSSVINDHIIMSKGDAFVRYDKYGIHKSFVAKQNISEEPEERSKWEHFGEMFITILIVLNALAAGAMTYLADDSDAEHWLNIFCDISIVIFIIEILIRIFGKKAPKEFFLGKDAGWNWFDLIITVISSLTFFTSLEGIVGARAIRILRELRLLRVVSGSENMKRIFHALIYALPQISWTSLFFVLLYYIYGIIGVEIFGSYSDSFATLHETFLTLLQLMTFDDWMALTQDLMVRYPLAWIYTVTFLILAAYILANLIVGIVVDSLNEVNARDEMEKSDIDREFAKLTEQVELLKKMMHNSNKKNDASSPKSDEK